MSEATATPVTAPVVSYHASLEIYDLAYKLNVAIKMLHEHDCREDDTQADSLGGFDLSVVADLLTAIRDDLRAMEATGYVKAGVR